MTTRLYQLRDSVDKFILGGVTYRKMPIRRDTTYGKTNAVNTATGVRVFILPDVEVTPLTDFYLTDAQPIICEEGLNN